LGGRVEIRVAGQKFSVTHDHDEAHIRELAQYVNDKIADLRRRTGAVATHSLALLAALDIADEYFQERNRSTELRAEVGQRIRQIMARVREQLGSESEDGVSVRAAADVEIDQRLENDG